MTKKTKKIILSIMAASIILAGCSNMMTTLPKKMNANGKGKSASYKNPANQNYMDATSRNVDTETLNEEVFFNVCEGTYRNGEDYIKVDKSKGMISVYINNLERNEFQGKTLYFEMEPKLKAAGESLVYLEPKDLNTLMYENDGKILSAKEYSNLLPLVPLYGFGKNRIEVNNSFGESIFVKKGTFWRE